MGDIRNNRLKAAVKSIKETTDELFFLREVADTKQRRSKIRKVGLPEDFLWFRKC